MQRLTRRTHVQLVLFVLLAVVGTTYISARYVGLDPFSSGYRVTAQLPETGGLFENGEVTYRGVPVGEIAELTATEDGVEAVLEIDADAPEIPRDSTVQVSNRSAIGEQYLDLSGSASDGEMLAEGDRLTAGAEAMPPDIAELLRTGRDFAASVPKDALETVIDETYALSQGTADDLRRLVDTSLDFHETADRNFLVSSALIRSSATVLQTQEEASASMRSYSEDLGLIADTLRDSDGDLRALIANSPAAAREISALMDEVGRPLGVLMGNLISTAQVFGTNARGVEDALIRAPEAISVGWAISGSKGLNIGLAPTFFDPLPCTEGYGGTDMRPGTDTTAGKPLNLKAGCTVDPASGSNVRGPESLPEPRASRVAVDVRVPSTLAELMGAE